MENGAWIKLVGLGLSVESADKDGQGAGRWVWEELMGFAYHS